MAKSKRTTKAKKNRKTSPDASSRDISRLATHLRDEQRRSEALIAELGTAKQEYQTARDILEAVRHDRDSERKLKQLAYADFISFRKGIFDDRERILAIREQFFEFWLKRDFGTPDELIKLCEQVFGTPEAPKALDARFELG